MSSVLILMMMKDIRWITNTSYWVSQSSGKSEEQSRIDNPERGATLCIRHWTKTNKQTNKQTKQNNKHNTEN